MKESVTEALTQFSPSRGICLILAVAMIAWGGWVMLPFMAFNAPSFALMSGLASEAVWGAIMLFGGLTLGAGVWMRDVDWIRSGAFLGFAIWTVIAILGTIADPTGTGFSLRGALAAMHAWMWLQVRLHPQLITGEVKIKDLRDYVAHNKEETKI